MIDEEMHKLFCYLVHIDRTRQGTDCRDYAAIIANRLDPVMVLQNSTHCCPLYRGVLIDITVNAYIKDFDWRKQINPTDYTHICTTFSLRLDWLEKLYSEPASQYYIVPSMRMNMSKLP